jgi:hypothetical protein
LSQRNDAFVVNLRLGETRMAAPETNKRAEIVAVEGSVLLAP